jgi:hypothetical protein
VSLNQVIVEILEVKKRNPEATASAIAEAVPWVFHRNGERIKSFGGPG